MPEHNWIYWKEEAKERPWKQIPDTPKALELSIKQDAMYSTWMSFSKPPKDGEPEPIRFGDFPLDFDDAKDPGKALKDLKALCLVHLPEIYDVDPYSIKFYLSGGKGFHAIIPAELFGAQAGDPRLPLIYKKIATLWKEQFNLKTLDLSLYCMGRGKMFRLPNIKRSNGLYKVPLTLEEVQDLPIEKLTALGAAPRGIEPVECDLSPRAELAELYKIYKKEVHQALEKQKSGPPARREKLPKKLPKCIEYILSELPKTDKTTFNKLTMILVNFFQQAGFDEDETLGWCSLFIMDYSHSTSYPETEDRLKHFDSQIKYLSDKSDYAFDCAYILGLGFPGSAFDCKRCELNAQKKEGEYTEEAKQLNEVVPQQEELSDFPDVMAGVTGRFAELYGQYLEAPAHFYFMAFLTCLGAVLSDRLTLDTEIRPQPRLYTILLGESADDKKSTAIIKTVAFFKKNLTDFAVCRGVGSAEGLQKRLQKTPSLLLCFDEFKQFVGKCKIEASVLLPAVNTLFEANEYETCTKKAEINLEGVYLSVLAASTVQTYERTWDSSFTDIGFNNRLFIVPGSGRKKHSFPPKVPSRELHLLNQELQDVLHHVRKNPELNLAQGAKEQYHSWYMNLENSVHVKRLDAYALRLMTLLAVNELKSQVDEDIINKVTRICNWQLEARQIHDPIDADNEIAKMEERVRRRLNKIPSTERELKQYTNASKTGYWTTLQ